MICVPSNLIRVLMLRTAAFLPSSPSNWLQKKKKKPQAGKKNKQEHKTRAYTRKGWQIRTTVIGGKNTSIRSIHVNFSGHATKRIIMFHIQRLGNKRNYWVVMHWQIQRKSFPQRIKIKSLLDYMKSILPPNATFCWYLIPQVEISFFPVTLCFQDLHFPLQVVLCCITAFAHQRQQKGISG